MGNFTSTAGDLDRRAKRAYFFNRDSIFRGQGILMAKGTVKWFNDVRGFGSIALDDGNEVLVDHSAVVEGGGFKSLNTGDRVSFDVVSGPRGPAAVNVVKA